MWGVSGVRMVTVVSGVMDRDGDGVVRGGAVAWSECVGESERDVRWERLERQ